jgi:integrase/recombinase XerD
VSSELIPFASQRHDVTVLPASPRDLVAAWLTGFRGATRAAYARDMSDFARWCEEQSIALVAVRRPHLEVYARSLDELRGLAPATIARRLAALASFYGYLVDEGFLERSPAERVKRPRVSQESPTLGLDRHELSRFLEAAESAGPLPYALACLLALNGLRISEAIAADIAVLRYERGHRVLEVVGKGGKVALVPLAPRTAAAIDALIAYSCIAGSGRLFGELDRYGAGRVIRKVARAAGIHKRISPHSLRHSFVTLSLDAGVPLRDVQVAARHADPKTTTRYDRARRNLDGAATYRLTAYLGD